MLRSAEFRILTVSVCFLSALFIIVFASRGRSEPSEFTTIDLQYPAEEPVGSIPAGNQAWEIPTTTCEDCDDTGTCTFGFAFNGTGGAILLYDFGKANLKEFSIPLRTDGVKVIEGIPLKPDDGVMAADGSIYLLVDRHYNGVPITEARYAIYSRGPNDVEWRITPAFNLNLVGGDGRGLGHNAIKLATDGDSLLYLNTREHSFAMSIHAAIASKNTLVERNGVNDKRLFIMTANPQAIFIRDKTGAYDTPILGGVHFAILGRDKNGNFYGPRILSVGSGYGIVRLSAQGIPLAAADISSTPVEKIMNSARQFMVMEDGSVIRFLVMKQELRISRIRF